MATGKYKITYVASICGSHYISTRQRCFRTLYFAVAIQQKLLPLDYFLPIVWNFCSLAPTFLLCSVCLLLLAVFLEMSPLWVSIKSLRIQTPSRTHPSASSFPSSLTTCSLGGHPGHPVLSMILRSACPELTQVEIFSFGVCKFFRAFGVLCPSVHFQSLVFLIHSCRPVTFNTSATSAHTQSSWRISITWFCWRACRFFSLAAILIFRWCFGTIQKLHCCHNLSINRIFHFLYSLIYLEIILMNNMNWGSEFSFSIFFSSSTF